MRHLSGVKGSMLQKAGLTRLPSERGSCELCGNLGHTRFFIAVKLDKIRILCDDDYRRLRCRLEELLLDILHEEFKE
jgi:hypothetical protein